MNITKFEDANEYYQRVESYLLQDEATNCLLLGLSKALSNSQKDSDNSPYLVTVEDRGKIAATAIQTPPRKLILGKTTNIEAIKAIARSLIAHNKSLPGVIAPKSEAKTFVDAWQSLTGQYYELDVAMKIHQLETVQSINKSSGNFRLAKESDCALLTNWIEAFESEALGDSEPRSDSQRWFERNLKNKSLVVWQDKAPVSMAAFGGATPHGIRINGVYTPPKYRGKGYATSCIATLSQQLLNKGYKYCFLFTNLANPTSNYIYRKIGYRPISEISNYGFGGN